MMDYDDDPTLRQRATHLLALAIAAREEGFSGAEELQELALEAVARTEEMDRSESRRAEDDTEE